MPAAISSSSAKKRIASRPFLRLSQSWSTVLAPGKRPARPTTASSTSARSWRSGRRGSATAGRRRLGPGRRAARRLGGGRCGERRRQRADRGALEQLDQGDVAVQRLAQTGVDAGEQQRMAAEVEEVVVDAHPLDLELLLPDGGDDP